MNDVFLSILTFVGMFALISVVLCLIVLVLAWLYADAELRGVRGRIPVVAFLLLGPKAILGWLLLRPDTVKRKATEHSEAPTKKRETQSPL